jgi:hypothetical protein
MVGGCGLGHPHRHLQRRASGVFYGVGAIGMARTGNNRQGLADVRMKGIMNRHAGRHGVVESVSSICTSTSLCSKGSIWIALKRGSSHALSRASRPPMPTWPRWCTRSAGGSSARCATSGISRPARQNRCPRAMILWSTSRSWPVRWRPRCSSALRLGSGLARRSGALAQGWAMKGRAQPICAYLRPFPPRLPHATCCWLPQCGLARCASHARTAHS